MDRRKFIQGAGTTLAIGALAGCTSESETGREEAAVQDNGETEKTSAKKKEATPKQDVKILEHEPFREQYSAGVRGIAQNMTDEELSYVGIKVYFLDSEGIQIEEGLDNTTDLAAGRKWRFEALMIQAEPSEVAKYEIEAEVTDY